MQRTADIAFRAIRREACESEQRFFGVTPSRQIREILSVFYRPEIPKNIRTGHFIAITHTRGNTVQLLRNYGIN